MSTQLSKTPLVEEPMAVYSVTSAPLLPPPFFNMHDAKSSLSRLVDRAAAGQEIIIAKAGKPAARLLPLEPTNGTLMGVCNGASRVLKEPDASLIGAFQRRKLSDDLLQPSIEGDDIDFVRDRHAGRNIAL
ncbi:MAG: type II toxin-antitoxin system prevent-host-death family antitoxin [Rhodocyclaceae bacterium]|nr:type II toxin-antitoxin system prevent-host-death family antitoxin [Rhodocyclaceae bacterium]